MQIIAPISLQAKRLLPAQKYAPGMRLLRFLLPLRVEDGMLLYNTMTKELLLLSDDEWQAVTDQRQAAEDAALYDHLARQYFMVPVDHDDCRLSDEIRAFLKKIYTVRKDGKIGAFTILTTTDCNARCYYCYEKGCEKITMSEKTAADTAAYILKHGADGNIRIQWFGGEPLFNMPAIDTICSVLRGSGKQFTSTMISNAYLFDEDLARKAAANWHLTNIQVTLDGTEDTYNAAKNFIYLTEESPFRRVTRNIRLLLEQGIRVSIRLNMSETNEEELRQVALQVREETEGLDGLDIYSHLLFDLTDDEPGHIALQKRGQELNRWLHLLCHPDRKDHFENMFRDKLSPDFFLEDVRIFQCMADNLNSEVLMPDGKKTKCEHFNKGSFYGSIYTDETDRQSLEEWNEQWPAIEACRTCAAYPNCFRLKNCEAWQFGCTEWAREFSRDEVKKEAMKKYLGWKMLQQDGQG